MTFRTPMGRVLGSGSAKSGTGHFWRQRVTAVALVLLGAWLLVALMRLPGFDHDTVRAWLDRPLNAVLMILLAGTAAWHSSLGVQVVIEDYVHQPLARVTSLILSKFVHALLAAAAVFAVLDLAFGAAA
ncbi:MAG TPA: succinate dehydrogenase, hydrophobic membrane anchor protein [Woeseiaceae bacterium]|nr:succinate dehydrogenase, hydrophobic membrane anchor protein [Woeseiaceae bacterium]